MENMPRLCDADDELIVEFTEDDAWEIYQQWNRDHPEEVEGEVDKSIAKNNNSESQETYWDGFQTISVPRGTDVVETFVPPNDILMNAAAVEPIYGDDIFGSLSSSQLDFITNDNISPRWSNSNLSDSNNYGYLEQPLYPYSPENIQMDNGFPIMFDHILGISDNSYKEKSSVPELAFPKTYTFNHYPGVADYWYKENSIPYNLFKMNPWMPNLSSIGTGPDSASAIIDILAKHGESELPKKGKLLDAVEAVPLLKTVLVPFSIPPVPIWRNPPPPSSVSLAALLLKKIQFSADADRELTNRKRKFSSLLAMD
ncbi:hypothetical protein ACFE04_019963 [Oxalis oulophora]